MLFHQTYSRTSASHHGPQALRDLSLPKALISPTTTAWPPHFLLVFKHTHLVPPAGVLLSPFFAWCVFPDFFMTSFPILLRTLFKYHLIPSFLTTLSLLWEMFPWTRIPECSFSSQRAYKSIEDINHISRVFVTRFHYSDQCGSWDLVDSLKMFIN